MLDTAPTEQEYINSLENNNNIDYNIYKSKQLDSIVMGKYANTKNKSDYVTDTNNFYLIRNNDYGDYDILDKISIEGNEDFIREIERIYDNYDNTATSNSENIENFRFREGNNNRNTFDFKEETWGEFIARILEETKSQNTNTRNDIRQSSKDVNNTSILEESS